jgi:hypothetical protein
MSGIKVLKDNEIPRPVYKKPFSKNIDWLLPLWAF